MSQNPSVGVTELDLTRRMKFGSLLSMKSIQISVIGVE